MNRINIQITVGFLIFTILLGSCASTTVIRSEPEGAKVYINEESVGDTPYSYTDTKIWGTRTDIRLEKEGYTPFTTTLVRNEEVNVGAIIGTFFVLIPVLWIMEYKPVHTYELARLAGDDSVDDVTPGKSAMDGLSTSQIIRLRKLKELQDDGIISKEEFEEQKAKILNDDQ